MTMTVEQAFITLDRLCNFNGSHYEEALSVIRAHVEREVTDELTPAYLLGFYDGKNAKVVLDDEMVERAVRAYNAELFTSPATHDQAMRAALQAALGGKDEA